MRRLLPGFALAAGLALAGVGVSKAAPDDSTLRFYPAAAKKAGVEGKALINCRMTASAGLADCRVVSESPEGYGFGDAALQVAGAYKLDPAVRQGQPDEARITIPIIFNLPRPPSPRPYNRDASRLSPG